MSDPTRSPSDPPPPSDAPSSRPTSMPPSEPRPSRGSFATIDAQLDERPVRVQMVVALVLGLVLVAIPLYLWRRPRSEPVAVTLKTPDSGGGSTAAPPDDPAPAPSPRVTVSAPKTLACQDPGPKKTPPDKCDHLEEVETGLAKAIEESASCVPEGTTGTIVYVADVSFKKKSIGVVVPRDGRTIKTSSVVMGCQKAVKAKLASVAVGSLTHEHARYKISVTATYGKKGD